MPISHYAYQTPSFPASDLSPHPSASSALMSMRAIELEERMDFAREACANLGSVFKKMEDGNETIDVFVDKGVEALFALDRTNNQALRTGAVDIRAFDALGAAERHLLDECLAFMPDAIRETYHTLHVARDRVREQNAARLTEVKELCLKIAAINQFWQETVYPNLLRFRESDSRVSTVRQSL